MKKIIIPIALLSVVIVSCYMGYREYQLTKSERHSVSLKRCDDAIANCEVFDSEKNLIADCVGETGVCWEMGNFFCNGRKTN